MTPSMSLSLLWIVSILPVAFVAMIPTSNTAQAMLGLAAVLTVWVLKPVASRMLPRFILLATASLVVMRYWFWRVTQTIPAPDLSADFTLAVLLLAVESFSIAVFFLNAFITADPTAHGAPAPLAPEDLPTVDVLVPSYNEPPEMLVITLSAAKNMIYPADKLRVVLCDDGGTDQRCQSADPAVAEPARRRRDELQRLCASLGVEYRTRARNEHAKAGNLSAAMATLSGELVVVFDADHVPSRDFLFRTVGYFREDPKLFLVQTPHFFINKDPIERNLRLAPRCPAESEMFYGRIHGGLDRWGGAFFCGSAALLRRAALDSVGGFSGETITEDAETALEIHASGWRSLYLDHAMIAGLQPETFSSFVQQRGRWATGMIQMLLLKGPLLRRGLTLPQRLCYLNSMAFWFFPIVRLAYIAAPLAYLFFGVEIFVATWQSAVAFVVAYLAVSFLTQNALYARHRWPLISEVYEIAQAPYLARAIFSTVLRPRSATFKVTSKTETLDEPFLSPIYRPLLALFGLTALGVAALAARWQMFPGDRSVLIVVGSWAVLNFLLVGLALRAVCERRQRRNAPRVPLEIPAAVSLDPEATAPIATGTITDGSMTGARLMLDPGASPRGPGGETIAPGDRVWLTPRFDGARRLERPVECVVRTHAPEPGGARLGLSFADSLPIEAHETLAFLVFGESSKWLELRRAANEPRGLVAGLAYVLGLSLLRLPGTLRFLLTMPTEPRYSGAAARLDERQSLLSFEADLAAFRADADSERRGVGEHTPSPVATG